MSSTTLPEPVKVRLQSHFMLARLPFRKSVKYDETFDSRAQRELLHGLQMWAEIKGMALATGPSGAGKSITARRFVRSLDESRFHVVTLPHGCSTLHGFLRAINRALDLPMRQQETQRGDARSQIPFVERRLEGIAGAIDAWVTMHGPARDVQAKARPHRRSGLALHRFARASPVAHGSGPLGRSAQRAPRPSTPASALSTP